MNDAHHIWTMFWEYVRYNYFKFFSSMKVGGSVALMISSSDFFLHHLQRNRLKQVSDHLNTLNSLCLVLGMDFRHIAGEIHSTSNDSKGTKDVSNHTIEKLASAVQSLREVKIQRMQRVSTCVNLLSYCPLVKTFFFSLDLFKPWSLPGSKPCKYPVGDVEFDGHTNGGATAVS
jgi:hypothetical protein